MITSNLQKMGIKRWLKPQIALLGILLIGLFLRLIGINSRGIWYDDAFSILLARRNISQIIIGTAADTMPPGYYLILHLWGFISQEIWFLRLLNVILSLFVIVLIYLIANRLGGECAGIMAGFFVAISPFQIYHAQEVRMYSLLAASLLLHVYTSLLLNEIRRFSFSSIGLILIFIFSGALSLYTHNLAVFSFIGLNFFLVTKKNWKKLLQLIALQLIIGLLFVPWLVLLPGQIEKIQTAFWTPKPGLIEVIQSVITLLATLPLSQTGIYVSAILIAMLATLTVIQLKSYLKKNSNVQFLLILIISSPILLFITSWFMRPIFVPRAFVFSGILIYVLISYLFFHQDLVGLNKTDVTYQDKKGSNFPSISAIIILVLISVISLPYQYTYHFFPRSDFKEMINIAARDCGPDCAVIHDNKLSFFPAIVYYPESKQEFIKDIPLSHNDSLAKITQDELGIHPKEDIQSAAADTTEVRFVVFDKAIQEYKAAGQDNHPKLKWLNENMTFVKVQHIGDLQIHFFIKNQ